MSDRKPNLLLTTSNGIGMGHLARQAALALAARPGRATVLSLSVAMPAVRDIGIDGEYAPGPDRGWFPEQDYPHYLAGRIGALGRAVNADVVVFDGVAPYRGVTLARRHLPKTRFVWFRRGMWRPGVNQGQLWKSGLFDLVIEPGDMAGEADNGPTTSLDDAVLVSPVGLLDQVDQLERGEAAEALGLEPDRPTALIHLGSGRLGDVTNPGRVAIEGISKARDWQIAVVTSSIAKSIVQFGADPKIVPIEGVFPLVRFLNAFDFVVSAAGYNAVHEYVAGGLPTVLVPNSETRTDDQVARSRHLSKAGLASLATSETEITTRVDEMLDAGFRADMRSSIAELPSETRMGGADQTAQILADIVEQPMKAPSLATRSSRIRDDIKQSLKRALGPAGTNRLRAVLGRPPLPSGSRMKVSLDDEHSPEIHRLTMTTKASVEQLLGDEPVEHLFDDGSASYMADRRLLIDRHYEVVS